MLVYLTWLGVLHLLTPIRATGALIRMVQSIIIDIKWFMFVLGIALVGAAHALWVIVSMEEETEGFNDLGDALFTSFRAFVMGEYDPDEFAHGPWAPLVKCIYLSNVWF